MTVEATIGSTRKLPARWRRRKVSISWGVAGLTLLVCALMPAVASASRPPNAQEQREIVAVSQHIRRAPGSKPKVGVSNLRVTEVGRSALTIVTLYYAAGPSDSAEVIYHGVRGHWTAAAHSAGTRQPPRLGRPWGPYQIGYGTVRPTRIFNGGDPTGEVTHIHWADWGSSQAIGEGDAEYVWPGTSVASNGDTSGARVVAFQRPPVLQRDRVVLPKVRAELQLTLLYQYLHRQVHRGRPARDRMRGRSARRWDGDRSESDSHDLFCREHDHRGNGHHEVRRRRRALHTGRIQVRNRGHGQRPAERAL
jgi:hypothetical protein